MSEKPKSGHLSLLYCSFCGKSQMEVRKLIAGPTVFICDECVVLCMDMLRDDGLIPANGPVIDETAVSVDRAMKS